MIRIASGMIGVAVAPAGESRSIHSFREVL